MIPSRCPRCQSALEVERLRCASCSTQVEGTFILHEIFHLSPTELTFLIDFVRSSGSLKKMATQYGLSYPTIRNRLNELIEKLGPTTTDHEAGRLEILDAIAQGTLSVAEGAERLRGLNS